MLSLLFLGFLLGMRHALEADHVAAVASLTSSTSNMKQAIKLGSIWGIGHTITLFIFGSLVLFSHLLIPDQLAKWLEFMVGIMLLVLGIDVLRRLYAERIHYHVHQHDSGQRHFHAHSHQKVTQSSGLHEHAHVQSLSYRALFVGIMHGMAGSAALILLTLETIQTPLQGILYIFLFGVGSILGMAVLSYIISIPIRASARGMTWMHNSLQILIACFTIGLGLFVMISNSHLLA